MLLPHSPDGFISTAPREATALADKHFGLDETAAPARPFQLKCFSEALFTRLGLADAELCPWTSVHVTHHRRLPIEFRMLMQEFRGIEIHSAGMSDAREEAHVRGHLAVHDFALNSAHRLVRTH